MDPISTEAIFDEVADALAREKKVLVTAHVNPDADALGSMIAMHRALSHNGADSIMYLSGAGSVAPEYHFLEALSEVRLGKPPEDAAERTLIAVDCGNADRIGNEELVEKAPRIINIDHHGDNSRFGTVNLVIGSASSTAEIIFFILGRMGLEIDVEMAQALYSGILVDSGRFQYSSTTPTTLRVAADLISSGVDHTLIFRNIYETMPLAKSRLLCRMFNNLTMACDGRLAIGVLEKADFAGAGADGQLTEGLVDSLRAIEGVQVGALIYERPRTAEDGSEPQDEVEYRVSLRSSTDKVDVQRIARARNGGGHKQAAGLSTTETPSETVQFLVDSISAAFAGQ
ncbi:MAG: bifunctional oligoribonuclease/PAP phosphatase NrnA [Thermoleophilia bacterium]